MCPRPHSLTSLSVSFLLCNHRDGDTGLSIEHVEGAQEMMAIILLSATNRLGGWERHAGLLSSQAHTGHRWTWTQCQKGGQGTQAFPVWGQKRYACEVEEILCLVGCLRQGHRESLGHRITEEPQMWPRNPESELPITSRLQEES